MKTLKQIAVEAARNKPEPYFSEPFEPHSWVLDAMQEAIGIDRENVAKHAKAHNGGTIRTDDGPLSSFPAYVDKNSIINAPPLKLE